MKSQKGTDDILIIILRILSSQSPQINAAIYIKKFSQNQ